MINFDKVFLGSSSAGKLAEYASFGLKLKQKTLEDAPEVLGTEEEVIIYKALNFGENILVEDTSLSVEGADLGINIKWLLHELHNNSNFNGKKAVWQVYLGLVYEGKMYLAESSLSGVIVSAKANRDSFGFDSVFLPDGESKTLWELKQEGLKTNHSARKKAIDKLLSGEYSKVLDLEDIPLWTGKYQK